jgi:hypothetical protein
MNKFFFDVNFFKAFAFLHLLVCGFNANSQNITTIIVNDRNHNPIEYCRVITSNNRVYTDNLGRAEIITHPNDSIYLSQYGYQDTIIKLENWPSSKTVVLTETIDTLYEITVSSEAGTTKKISFGGKNKLIQREPSDIRLVAFKERNARIDSLRIIVRDISKDGAAFRAVVYDKERELYAGPVLAVSDTQIGLLTLPLSFHIANSDSIYVGIEFINTLINDPMGKKTAYYRTDKKGLFSDYNNGATLAGTKKKRKNEDWIAVTHLNYQKTIRHIPDSIFFAAPYMEIYFTSGL